MSQQLALNYSAIQQAFNQETQDFGLWQTNQKLKFRNWQLKQQVARLQEAEVRLRCENERLKQEVGLDSLTRIANRGYFNDYLQQEWKRAQREQRPLAAIFADVDCFKQYNDRYGHLLGDHCLRAVAHSLQNQAQRPADLVARYGGEEFVILLPNTPLAGAIDRAKQMHQTIEALHMEHLGSSVKPIVTLSFGVTSMIPCPCQKAQMLLANADTALYRAKAQGRDRVIWV
jgi:diguanylate cyclase (GGDEF)-like protein